MPASSSPTRRARRALRACSAARSTRPMSRPCAAAPTSKSTRRIWRRNSLDSGHHMAEAAVDVKDLAGDRRGQVGKQERRGIAHVLGGDVPSQRRMLLDELEDLAEAADSRRGERLDRPGRDAVHADAARPEARGEVAYRSF